MKSRRLGFRTTLILGGMVLMFVPALTAGWFYTGALQAEAERLVAESLRSRGELATDLLARRLHASWLAVSHYAKTANVRNGPEAQRDFTMIDRLDDRIAWIGMADLNGTVVAASNGMLTNANVSQRPWFRRGLAGPFAGDVHEALLLQKLLGKADEPLRFIDFAAPVQSDQGTSGVVGVHIRWDWVRSQLAGISDKKTDILLLSRDGRVLYGPPSLEGQILGIGAAVVAGQAGNVVRRETWPDGRVYMTAVIPSVRFQDLPSFGWSVIVREDLDHALGPIRQLTRTFWMILGSAGFISLALLLLGATWMATPLRRQVTFASALAERRSLEAPPYEETRYQEVADLSAALVRLQSEIGNSAREAADAIHPQRVITGP
jgi:hypothetical protein